MIKKITDVYITIPKTTLNINNLRRLIKIDLQSTFFFKFMIQLYTVCKKFTSNMSLSRLKLKEYKKIYHVNINLKTSDYFNFRKSRPQSKENY